MVAEQLLEVVNGNNIFDKFQSGFRHQHSTETALLRVTNDILMHADAGEHSILVLLDLRAAFDTIDHSIMLDRLNKWVGISGTALEWFSSYLSNRSFSVSFGDCISSSAPLSSGPPRDQFLALYYLRVICSPLAC